MDKFASKLSGKIGEDKKKLETATYVLATYAVLEVAEHVFHIGKGFTTMDLTAYRYHQIKKGIEKVEKKVDKLLQAPMQLASRYYDSALDMIMYRKMKDGFDNLNKVIDRASEAFLYNKDKKINIETFIHRMHKSCYSNNLFYHYEILL